MCADMDRSKAVDLAITQIERQFGKGSIMKLGSREHMNVPVISTGSLSLDIALGTFGVPRGRVVEIYGPESGGKTTLALHIVAEAQKQGGIAAYIDAEHALDVVYAQKIGVNTDELLISQPDTGEQALAELGMTGIRFRVSVHHGDTLYAFSEVLETRESDRPDAGIRRQGCAAGGAGGLPSGRVPRRCRGVLLPGDRRHPDRGRFLDAGRSGLRAAGGNAGTAPAYRREQAPLPHASQQHAHRLHPDYHQPRWPRPGAGRLPGPARLSGCLTRELNETPQF